MSDFYENVLLREEFYLVQKLQKDSEFAKYVSVKYEDRVTGETRHVIFTPSADKYPEIFIVVYHLPVYIANGQIRNDFLGTATITLSEPVLVNRTQYINYHADFNGPNVAWVYNFQPYGIALFSPDSHGVCSGTAWNVAKDFGVWHFIISLGALLNQDKFVCGNNSIPATNIKWPLDLISKSTITIISKEKITEKRKISIVRKKEEQPTVRKITIIKK